MVDGHNIVSCVFLAIFEEKLSCLKRRSTSDARKINNQQQRVVCVTKDKRRFRVLFVKGSIRAFVLLQRQKLKRNRLLDWYLFSENAIVTISKIAKFLTESSKIPATGLNKNVTVMFKHGCFPSKRGNMCKCLPTVSTCEIIVNIPVHITSEEDMMNAFKDALLSETGFGFI